MQGGAVRTSDDFSTYVIDQVRQGLGRREAVAVGLAHEAAGAATLQSIIEMDRELEALKVCVDSRKASRQMGRQVIRVAAEHFDEPLVENYLAAIEAARTPGIIRSLSP